MGNMVIMIRMKIVDLVRGEVLTSSCHVSLMFLECIRKMVGLLTFNKPQVCLLKQLWESMSASIRWETLFE